MSETEKKPAGVLAQSSVKLRFTFAMLLAAVGLLFLTAYIMLPAYRDEMKFGASLAVGLTAIYSAFYFATNFRYRNKQELVARSLDSLKDITSYDFTLIRMQLEQVFDQAKVPPAELYDRICADTTTHAPVLFLLNTFEHLAFLVRLEYVDEETLYLSLNYLLPYWVGTCKPYIDERRRRKDKRSLYTDSEALANAWTSGKLLSTGKEVEVALE
jgi:hypothetical protein